MRKKEAKHPSVKRKIEEKESNSSSSTTENKPKKVAKRIKIEKLPLDQALSQTNMEDWSEARKRAYTQIDNNPNMYYYRFNAPGEKQKNGGWSHEEKTLFLNRMKELGGIDYKWGIFSMSIPGRVGYQCANFYRKLIKDNEIQDPNYIFNEKGEPVYIGKGGKKGHVDDETDIKQPTLLDVLHVPHKKVTKRKSKNQNQKIIKAKLTEEEKRKKFEERKQKLIEEKQRRQEQLQKQWEEDLKGKEILPRLYIGNKRTAQNKEWLQSNQVRYILNATREVSNYFEEEFQYKRISITDSMEEDAKKYFEEASEFIRDGLAQECGVLVHCNEGRSRCATFTMAYLLKHEKWDLKKGL